MISMLPLLECITCSLSLSIKTVLFAIVICIFHESNYLRLFIMSYRPGLILLKYFSTDSILNLSHLLLYSA